jgi:hypothetical protein
MLGPPDEAVELEYPGRPKSVLVDRIHWARSYGKLSGALDSPERDRERFERSLMPLTRPSLLRSHVAVARQLRHGFRGPQTRECPSLPASSATATRLGTTRWRSRGGPKQLALRLRSSRSTAPCRARGTTATRSSANWTTVSVMHLPSGQLEHGRDRIPVPVWRWERSNRRPGRRWVCSTGGSLTRSACRSGCDRSREGGCVSEQRPASVGSEVA